MGTAMVRNLQRLLITSVILIASCSGIKHVDKLPLPSGETVIYVSAANKSLGISSVDLEVIDRYLYDPKTGKTTLIATDSSSANKSAADILKSIPIPPIIP